MYEFWLWLGEKLGRKKSEPSVYVVGWGEDAVQAHMPIPKAEAAEGGSGYLVVHVDRSKRAAYMRKYRARKKAELERLRKLAAKVGG